jgi:uncharacterized protein
MKKVTDFDWNNIYESLNNKGYAQLPAVLSAEECEAMQKSYTDSSLYRNVINMQRYRFGTGEYNYFSYPLPVLIQTIRESFYQPLAVIANAWMKQLDMSIIYPQEHGELIQHCHNQNQLRPTPLILRYETGGHNTLHQDLYGEVYFPFQIVFILTQKGRDHEGGELVLTEQVPRAQSKAEVITPDQGDAIIFTTNFRPIKGTRGYYRATFKHGVSEVKSGVRFALGIIFHDAS